MEPSLNSREFRIVKIMTMKNFLMKLWTRLVWTHFTRSMKGVSVPDGFILYGNLAAGFFSTSEMLHPNMKVRLRLIRARPNFYMISGNSNVSLGIVDSSV